jgi:hypothetical protein
MKKLYLFLPAILIVFQSCSQQSKKQKVPTKADIKLSENFGDYWYQGQAELTSYDLQQVRYGEKRDGHAVLIYVTEDFSKSKQVKLDNPEAAGDDSEKVMKLNFTKKFDTGIYPYSIMTSVFSPVYPETDLHARKITTSVQEWCGHVFMQLNNEGAKYQVDTRSYFESEGDEDTSLEKVWLEDELWTMLRLDPNQIPEGDIKLIPSTQYLRLKHKETKAYSATVAKLSADSLEQLTISLPELERTVSIFYQSAHPYQIEKWEETYPEAGEMMTTTGTLRKRVMLDYWNRNGVQDSVYREPLGLE